MQDEEVSDTDIEQQTSEYETFFFYVHSRGFAFSCKISALTQIFLDLNSIWKLYLDFHLINW